MHKRDASQGQTSTGSGIRQASQDALLAFAQLLARLVADKSASGASGPATEVGRPRWRAPSPC